MGSTEAEIPMDSGDVLDAAAIAAEATRPSNIFSPRSTAALTLSSISTLQPAAPQQTLFHGEERSSTGQGTESDENSSGNGAVPVTKADSVTKDDFCPPKDPKASVPDHMSHKTRRVSEGVAHSTERLPHDRPRAPLQRSTSAVATPGGSGNKLCFVPPTDARESFHPPHPAVAPHGHPSFFYMYPSHTPHASRRNDVENRPNQQSSGKGNSPDNAQPIPYNPSEPQKFSPMHTGPFHSHDRKASQHSSNHPQQHHHSVDFQPPAWKTHSNREHRHLAPAHSYRPRRSMPMPAPVMSGGWGEQQYSNNNGWEQQQPHHSSGGVPHGTPFIMVRCRIKVRSFQFSPPSTASGAILSVFSTTSSGDDDDTNTAKEAVHRGEEFVSRPLPQRAWLPEHPCSQRLPPSEEVAGTTCRRIHQDLRGQGEAFSRRL